MPALNSLARVAAKAFPRLISKRAHSFLDYFVVGSFVAGAGLFWKRSKKASLGALISAAAELAVILLTDYPGGLKKAISFPCGSPKCHPPRVASILFPPTPELRACI
jgi:hypothetical protein